MKGILNVGLIISVFLMSCQSDKPGAHQSEAEEGAFAYDMQFLAENDSVVLLQDGKAMVLVSPKYQGRVMTSSSQGMSGLSYGWLNYDLIHSGEILAHINPVGGEERFWLGPEGGQFSIYFSPGSDFVFEDWQTPPPIDTQPYKLTKVDGKKLAHFESQFQLMNYSSYTFDVKVDREVKILSREEIEKFIGVKDKIDMVAYQTRNSITNAGEEAWTEDTGALSIWLLGMYRPTEQTVVIVPFKQGDEPELGPIVNDDYFGKVSEDRLKVIDGNIYFKADGASRGKIGLSPMRARNYMGSFDAKNEVLSLVFFNKPENATQYVNSLWELQEQPFAGDVVNSYNDGPVDGQLMGPFYELESSSPAAFLEPGETLTHVQQTMHLQGNMEQLNRVVDQLFHTNIHHIRTIFSEK